MEKSDIEKLKAYQAAYNNLSQQYRNHYIQTLESNRAAMEEIRYLAKVFLGRNLATCIHTYIESHIKLMKLQGIEPKTIEYEVYPGTFKTDPVNMEIDWVLTPATLRAKGEEMALRHLSNNPAVRKFFSKLPEDVDVRIASYRNNGGISSEESGTSADKPKKPRKPRAKKIVEDDSLADKDAAAV